MVTNEEKNVLLSGEEIAPDSEFISFDLVSFMRDTGCSETQGVNAARTFLEGRVERSQVVRAWNPEGPDKSIGDYMVDGRIREYLVAFRMGDEIEAI